MSSDIPLTPDTDAAWQQEQESCLLGAQCCCCSRDLALYPFRLSTDTIKHTGYFYNKARCAAVAVTGLRIPAGYLAPCAFNAPMPMPTAAQCFFGQHANIEGDGRCAVRNAVTRAVVLMACRDPESGDKAHDSGARALTPLHFPTSLLTTYRRASNGASSAATTYLFRLPSSSSRWYIRPLSTQTRMNVCCSLFTSAAPHAVQLHQMTSRPSLTSRTTQDTSNRSLSARDKRPYLCLSSFSSETIDDTAITLDVKVDVRWYFLERTCISLSLGWCFREIGFNAGVRGWPSRVWGAGETWSVR